MATLMTDERSPQSADIRDECVRLVEAAGANGIRLRALGGLAIGLHSHGPLVPVLIRSYGDIDVVVCSSDGRKLSHLLPTEGWEPNRRFNALHGERRMIFNESLTGRKLDVFVGEFNMCHKLDLDSRLPEKGVTLELSDLLLTKLQVVELNAKDLTDVILLLAEHDVAPADHAEESVALNRVTEVCAHDWGWYTSVHDNLERVAVGATDILERELAATVAGRARVLQETIEAAPKSVKWRARSKLGRRFAWYELPEETGT